MSPPSTRTPAPPRDGERRLDGSMSLLVDVMTNTLDESYAERAARRAGEPTDPPGAPARRAGVTGLGAGAAALVVLGLLTGTAVAQVRDRAADAAGLRGQLADEVSDRSEESDRLAAEVADLRAEVTATRDRALAADVAGRQAADRLRTLELAAGTSAVTGPGVVLTVDDADPDAALEPDPRLRGGSPLDGRVLDRDLQDVVNGLWAAGAEAVAINGVRLSSRAAIRSAGEAVLVDFRPLSPPYEVEALGRPASLEVGFLDGPAGRRLETLASFSGITFSLRRAEDLRLDAATEPQLRSVELPEGPS